MRDFDKKESNERGERREERVQQHKKTREERVVFYECNFFLRKQLLVGAKDGNAIFTNEIKF